MTSAARIALATTAMLGLVAGSAAAQIGVAWVSFTKQPAQLALAPLAVSDSGTQVAFSIRDLNRDGWDDVVAVRKQPASQPGKRTAILLMNDHGVLRDKTLNFASTSDVPGDSGFLTPCNTYEAVIGDVNGDTWPDVVTTVGLSDGSPKEISHPRVYINRGLTAFGRWRGLHYEAARIPQLVTVGGLAVAPRFSGVALGDVSGDGFPDLSFVDFDDTSSVITEPSFWDLDDRLLVNDGSGFFTDQSAAAFTPTQLKSTFSADVKVLDLNADGHRDIVKCGFFPPIYVRALYNDPANVGNFTAMGVSDFGTSAPLGLDLGDLNHDSFADVVITDDGNDRFRLGTGFNAANQMVWGPLKSMAFVTGGDDGFGHRVYIRDLDGNGWNDVLIADVDVDIPGCNRRLHIYHNTGSVPGDLNLVLKEESEFANGSSGSGWKGAVGMTVPDMKGTFDVGIADFDNDGDPDLLVGTCNGTQYFRNESSAFGALDSSARGGTGAPALAGSGTLAVRSPGTLTLSHAAPSAPSMLLVSPSEPARLVSGALLVAPGALALPLSTDVAGGIALSWSAWPAELSGLSLYCQFVVKDADADGGVLLSNALRVDAP
jgi:hypothetical protein